MEFTELIESCYGKLIGGKALTTSEKKKIKQASTKDKVAIFHHTYTPGLARKYNLVKAYIEEPSITTLLDHFTIEYGLSCDIMKLHEKYQEYLKGGNHVHAFKKVKWDIDEKFHVFLKDHLTDSKLNVDRFYNSVKTEVFFQRVFESLSWNLPNTSMISRDEIIDNAKDISIDGIDAKEIATRRRNALIDPFKMVFNIHQKTLINQLLLIFGHHEENLKMDKKLYHLLDIPGEHSYYIWLYLMGDDKDVLPISFKFYLQPDTLIINIISKKLNYSNPFSAIKMSVLDKLKKVDKKHLFTFHAFSIFLYDNIYLKYHKNKWKSALEKRAFQKFYLQLLHEVNKFNKSFAIANHYNGFNPENIEWASTDEENPWTFWRSTRKASRKKLL